MKCEGNRSSVFLVKKVEDSLVQVKSRLKYQAGVGKMVQNRVQMSRTGKVRT